jgi:hypothetical protein
VTISVQFHALPWEMPRLVADLIFSDELIMVEVLGSPPRFIERPPPRSDLQDDNQRRGLIFTLDRPQIAGAASLHQFQQRNPDALTLEIGAITPDGLTESWLSAKTENQAAVKRWRQASKSLRAEMLSGAEAVNPQTGASGPMKWHRFTKAAQTAYAEGLKMLPAAGNSIVRLPHTKLN